MANAIGNIRGCSRIGDYHRDNGFLDEAYSFYKESYHNGEYCAINKFIEICMNKQLYDEALEYNVYGIGNHLEIDCANRLDEIIGRINDEFSNDRKKICYHILGRYSETAPYADKIRFKISASDYDELEEMRKRIHELTIKGCLDHIDLHEKRKIDDDEIDEVPNSKRRI